MFGFSFGSREKKAIQVINLNQQYFSNINIVAQALGYKPKYSTRQAKSAKIFVLDFTGDLLASGATALSHEVTAIICSANPEKDQVLVKVHSPGGAAYAYGYAASQLERVKKAGIPLIVSVDKIAASGGYLMAVVADKIISAPWAIIGSVGVVAQFPNLNRLITDLGVDYRQYTAGKYKRTVSTFGEITEEGEEKFKEDLHDLYDMFREHIVKHRDGLDMDKVATGEHWTGLRAIELGLVDEIKTSEEFILENVSKKEILQIKYVGDQKTLAEKISGSMARTFLSTLFRSVENYLLGTKYLV